jgi:hypothetical protein
VLGPDERLVLVIDQFEEVFTLCTDEDERAAFVAAIVEAAVDPRAKEIIVLALRADFYGRCAASPSLAELLGANHVLVGPMTAEEYRRAIEQPALHAGVRIEPPSSTSSSPSARRAGCAAAAFDRVARAVGTA